MSEQNYMAQLDAWSNEHVIAPLLDNGTDAIERVQKNIRTKVLESYRNGQKVGPPWPKGAEGRSMMRWAQTSTSLRCMRRRE